MRAGILLLLVCIASSHAMRLEIDKLQVRNEPGAKTYRLDQPRKIAAILQRNGTHPFVLTNQPSRSWWEWSNDSDQWKPLAETTQTNDARLFRLHLLKKPIRARYLRLRFDEGLSFGEALFDSKPSSDPDAGNLQRFVIIVNSTHAPNLFGKTDGAEFIPLIASIPGWEKSRVQYVSVRDLTPALVNAHPRPLAVFFSGSYKDWCEVDRSQWRGVEQILNKRSTPMWASCGGAQALAILAETGTSKPWDCPHCRDPRSPKLPIYTHIGHTSDPKSCGDYSTCIFERGPHNVRIAKPDPVFSGLPDEFQVMESHCGQIEYPPRGWELIATAGAGSKTKTQCIKVKDAPIYAAQFHIEMDGTPESSRTIMSNFLREAEQWSLEHFKN